jgi:uncharacterized protein (DUF433 family)
MTRKRPASGSAKAGRRPKIVIEEREGQIVVEHEGQIVDVVKGRELQFPGIERTEGVCGGDPCIRDTRIPVWGLEQFRRLGLTEAEILDSYPTLRALDLVHAWAYVEAHRDEIDRQIRENEEA